MASMAAKRDFAETFAECKEAGKPAFIPYLTAGYPTKADTVPGLLALEKSGADIIEVGCCAEGVVHVHAASLLRGSEGGELHSLSLGSPRPTSVASLLAPTPTPAHTHARTTPAKHNTQTLATASRVFPIHTP